MAQERMARVTLLRPYEHNEHGRVTISGGQVSPLDAIATNVSINPADPAMQQPFNKDPHVEEYGRRSGPLEPIDLHQNVVYELGPQEGEQTTLMPLGLLKIHFGDWDIRPGQRSQVNPRCTYEAERTRVAMNWGGYELFPYVRRTAEGKIIADTRIIGAPKVPYVLIEEIDQRGNITGDTFDPWTFYKWELQIDKGAAAEARRRGQAEGYATEPQANQSNVDALIGSMLPTLVEAEVAKRMAALGGKRGG